MAYSIRCRDAGMECPGAFTTENPQEVIKHARMHLGEAHPEKTVRDEELRQLIQTAVA